MMQKLREMGMPCKSRFGGNDESRNAQVYLEEQQFKDSPVSNAERSFTRGYDRFQSLLSQLEIHGAVLSTEDANQKFLRSLPPVRGTQDNQEDGCTWNSGEIGWTELARRRSKAMVTIDEKTQPSESESQSSEFDTCESNISAEPSELVSEPVVNESNVKCQPKFWSDAPMIEEYESDSEDECVSIPTKQQETPSFANKQVKTPRENVKNHYTHNQIPKVDKKRNLEFNGLLLRGAMLFVRVNKQNQFVPSAVLTRTGKIPVSIAKASSTKKFNTARQSFNRQTVLTSTTMKFNTVKPIVNRVRPANVFYKTHSSSSRPFKKPTVPRTDFSKQKVNTAKAHDWEQGLPCINIKKDVIKVALMLGGSKGYITGKGKIKTGKLDFEDIENQLNQKVKTIRSDNGTEFKNRDVIEFCGSKGIKREYSNARTPQQNGVAERKNRTLIEAARTMLADSFLPNTFWAEAVSTACYVLNRLKSDEGFLVGYSLQSKAFRVYNLETKRVEENLHINFLENKPNIAGKGPTWLFDLDYLTDSMNYHPISSENQANHHAGQQESNQNAGTEDIIEAGDSEQEDESAQDCFVLPIWPSYSSTITPDLKIDEKRDGLREEEQVFMDELERLQRQEKEANEEAEALRKKFEHLVIKEGAARPSISTALSLHEGRSLSEPTNPEEDDSEIPPLEDIYQNSTDGIFTTSILNDEGACG
ncbi:ribonuclease H-like domain-containing protein [Tanacetum coccineum]|uniref:Ribonuclease H-like domain-containing protein n=1 Tax=Tanacetum coccineum TaxID=301880 RepID=A0ABQ5GDD7_9ASTR